MYMMLLSLRVLLLFVGGGALFNRQREVRNVEHVTDQPSLAEETSSSSSIERIKK